MPNQYMTLPIRDRLLQAGIRDENGCLLWPGRTSARGYGRTTNHGRDWNVHVVSYLIFVGGWIPKGMQVQHSCNVRRCYEPTHLSLGTNARNVAWRDACGRTARGETNGRAVVTEALVQEIRARAESIRGRGGPRKPGKLSLRGLADEYGLPWPTLQAIVNRKSWKHVA